jgi:hypothetical protein
MALSAVYTFFSPVIDQQSENIKILASRFAQETLTDYLLQQGYHS